MTHVIAPRDKKISIRLSYLNDNKMKQMQKLPISNAYWTPRTVRVSKKLSFGKRIRGQQQKLWYKRNPPENTESLCQMTKSEKIGKVRKRAKIRNRYNLAPHLTQNTNGKVTTSQSDLTNESQEVNPFPAGNHKALINEGLDGV